jgi:hypothetical protein
MLRWPGLTPAEASICAGRVTQNETKPMGENMDVSRSNAGVSKALLVGLLAMPYCAVNAATYFSDNFNDNYTDTNLWVNAHYGGPTATEQNGRVEFVIPADSQGAPNPFDPAITPLSQFGTSYTTIDTYAGNFDVSVDYSFLVWPENNGVRFSLGIGTVSQNAAIQMVSFSSNDSASWSGSTGNHILMGSNTTGIEGLSAVSAQAGSLRLIRVGNSVYGYYLGQDNQWVQIAVIAAPSGEVKIGFGIFSENGVFNDQAVSVACDNFSVQSYTASSVPDAPSILEGMGVLSLLAFSRWKNRQ